ncbi:MAG TPA: hypothetical protein VMQ76_07960, partial [Terracidiphilus sp.]|nr:hypothetical protein [Terracidiphilus sp.]
FKNEKIEGEGATEADAWKNVADKSGHTLSATVAASALGKLGGSAGKGSKKPGSGNRCKPQTCPVCHNQIRGSMETHITQIHPELT